MKVIKYGRWALVLLLPLVAGAGNAASSLANGRYPYAAPGVMAPSWPLFLDGNETVQVQRKGSGSNTYWQLSGSGKTASFWGSLSNSVNLGAESVRYQANFNSAGKLITSVGTAKLSNYLEIDGSLPAIKIDNAKYSAKNQPLLKADLLDANPTNGISDLIGTYKGSALGFNTKISGGWVMNNHVATGESLWLYGVSKGFKDLVNALDGNSNNGTLSTLIGPQKVIGGVLSVAAVGRLTGSAQGNTGISVAAVPVPGAVWLFGTGLMALFSGRCKNHPSRLAV
ncbi:MAG: hypothetical protein ACXV7J_15345 [Methylomonas sp.]